MHILYAPVHYVCTDKVGSEYYQALRLIVEIAKRNHEIEAIALCGYYMPSYEISQEIEKTLSSRLHVIRFYRRDPVFSDFGKLKFYFDLYKYIRNEKLMNKIDIIHHVLPFGFKLTFNFAYRLAKKYNKPFIIGPLQSPQLFLGHDEYEGMSFAKKAILQNVEIHRRIASPILFVLFRKTIENATLLITTTLFTKKLYEQYVKEVRILVIPFGINANSIEVKNYKNSDEKISIVYSGALIYRKGVHYLLMAFSKIAKQYPNVELHIYGDGPQKQHLIQLASYLGVSNKVFFHGSLPRQKLLKEYSKHNIYVHPSLSESFTVAVLEAMAAGLPVIAFNIPNLNEIVTHNKVGLLAVPHDINDLANKIRTLIENEELRKKFGQNARKKVLETYDWNVISQRYITIYRNIIDEFKNIK